MLIFQTYCSDGGSDAGGVDVLIIAEDMEHARELLTQHIAENNRYDLSAELHENLKTTSHTLKPQVAMSTLEHRTIEFIIKKHPAIAESMALVSFDDEKPA